MIDDITAFKLRRIKRMLLKGIVTSDVLDSLENILDGLLTNEDSYNTIKMQSSDNNHVFEKDGGPGSGNHGHAGVPGQLGGSAPTVGEVRSGKNGDFSPKSGAARTIDTRDALAESQSKHPNSLTDHMDENGQLSPERQAVHDEIIEKFFADKVSFSGTPSLVMSGGGPASGKTFVRTGAESEFGADTTVTIDPDSFKAMLPGYAEMAAESDEAAGFYHEESSALAKRAYQYAVDNGCNVVYDGTGDGSVSSVEKKIQTAQEAGYQVRASYVTVDTEEALRRNQARYEHADAEYKAGRSKIPPRLPKEAVVRETHGKVSDISIAVAPKFDSFELYDNNGPRGSQPVKIATCEKGGVVTAVPGCEQQLQAYLDKGSSGAKVVDGKVVLP